MRLLVCILLLSASLLARADALKIEPCHLKGIRTQVECGTFSVPVDHARPGGEKLQLRFARLPAVKSRPAADPLVFLAGGPGQSAVDVAQGIFYTFRGIRRDRDILLVDQRGTGGSSPLQCVLSEKANDLLGIYDLTEADIFQCLEQFQQQGQTLSHFTTDDSVRDLERLRRALRYTQVNLYGGSYGTRAALSYMRLYPDALRSVVLDSVAPAQIPIPLSGPAASRSFERLLDQCRADPRCHQAFPRVREEFNQLLAEVNQAPIVQPITHPQTGEPAEFVLDRDKLLGVLQLGLYAPSTRAMMPLIIHQAAKRQFAPLLGLAMQINSGLILYDGLHLNIICNEDYPRIQPDQRPTGAVNAFGTDESLKLYDLACPLWPQYQPDPAFYQPVAAAVPTLLLSGELDPITPPDNAEVARAQLANARHLVASNDAHTIVFTSCANTLVKQFIERPDPAALDASCLDEERPAAFVLDINGSL